MEKLCDTISIFQYQATIFYAQWYQMQCGEATKLSGINVWFIIEILSFYGYILAAILFILENQITSSLGWLKKDHIRDRYKTDFIVYHRREIDWFAFILILFMVNMGLIYIEENLVFTRNASNSGAALEAGIDENLTLTQNASNSGSEQGADSATPLPVEAGTLRPLMYQLLVNHSLHMVFKRHFFDDKRKIFKGHKWIWCFNLVSYGYIFYVYFFTDAKELSHSDYSKCWIPLDFILMSLVACFYFGSKAVEKIQDEQGDLS